MITAKRLKELLHYDPETGEFKWLHNKRVAGCKNDRYVRIRVDGILYVRARLAWLYMHGEWPSYEVDHIDRNSQNDRIVNLRDIKHSDNMLNMKHKDNNSSGYKGVYKAINAKWVAQITKDYYTKHLGTFSTKEEAAQAYEEALRQL